jgi:hypothetical protein
MNWKLILQLSLFGLAMGIATCVRDSFKHQALLLARDLLCLRVRDRQAGSKQAFCPTPVGQHGE